MKCEPHRQGEMRKLANERIRELDNEKINRLEDGDEKKRNGSEDLEGYRKSGLSL